MFSKALSHELRAASRVDDRQKCWSMIVRFNTAAAETHRLVDDAPVKWTAFCWRLVLITWPDVLTEKVTELLFLCSIFIHTCTYSAGSCEWCLIAPVVSNGLVWFHLKMNFLSTAQSHLTRLAKIQIFKGKYQWFCTLRRLGHTSDSMYFYITTTFGWIKASSRGHNPVFLPIHDKCSRSLPFQNECQTSERMIHSSSKKV